MVYQFTYLKIYDMLYQLKQQKPNVDIVAIIQENHTAGQDDDETRYIADKLVNELGATVKWASETIYYLTHAKFIIIDNKSVLVATGNLKDVNVPYNNTFILSLFPVTISNTSSTNSFRSHSNASNAKNLLSKSKFR